MWAPKLVAAVRASCPDATEWLDKIFGDAPLTLSAAEASFVGASRRVGRATVDAGELSSELGEISTRGWSADRAVRTALIMRASAEHADGIDAWLREVYRGGDSREKAAVVGALALVPEPSRFLDLAEDAGRTNETDLFEALSAHNPFPAAAYSESAFNKLVMKAAFVGTKLSSIMGLCERANAELSRMGMDYIDERQAAERPIPPDIWLAVAPVAPPGAFARMIGYLEHANAAQRAGAAAGLALAKIPAAKAFLRDRHPREADENAKRAIEEALSALGETP